VTTCKKENKNSQKN